MIPIALLLQALASLRAGRGIPHEQVRERIARVLELEPGEYHARVRLHERVKGRRAWGRAPGMYQSPTAARDAAGEWARTCSACQGFEVHVHRGDEPKPVLVASGICEVDITGRTSVRWTKSKRVRH